MVDFSFCMFVSEILQPQRGTSEICSKMLRIPHNAMNAQNDAVGALNAQNAHHAENGCFLLGALLL